jgi:hypothetical protein
VEHSARRLDYGRRVRKENQFVLQTLLGFVSPYSRGITIIKFIVIHIRALISSLQTSSMDATSSIVVSSSASSSNNGTTPLLLLLEEILAQDVERVKMSVSDIRTRLQAAAAGCSWTTSFADTMRTPLVVVNEPTLPSPTTTLPFLSSSSSSLPFLLQTLPPSLLHVSAADSSAAVADEGVVALQLLQSIPLLVSWIQQLLHVFPQWAQTCSARDGSLPLHLAASLGSVDVANIIFHHVGTWCIMAV